MPYKTFLSTIIISICVTSTSFAAALIDVDLEITVTSNGNTLTTEFKTLIYTRGTAIDAMVVRDESVLPYDDPVVYTLDNNGNLTVGANGSVDGYTSTVGDFKYGFTDLFGTPRNNVAGFIGVPGVFLQFPIDPRRSDTTSVFDILITDIPADTVDFTDTTNNGGRSYSDTGYQINAVGTNTEDDTYRVSSFLGEPMLFSSLAFEIRSENGLPFQLFALDVHQETGREWRIEGFFADGGSISQVMTFRSGDETTPFETLVFDGFSNLDSVVISPTTPNEVGIALFDNIDLVSTDIPEPSSLTLLGLIGLLLGRRRRQLSLPAST